MLATHTDALRDDRAWAQSYGTPEVDPARSGYVALAVAYASGTLIPPWQPALNKTESARIPAGRSGDDPPGTRSSRSAVWVTSPFDDNSWYCEKWEFNATTPGLAARADCAACAVHAAVVDTRGWSMSAEVVSPAPANVVRTCSEPSARKS